MLSRDDNELLTRVGPGTPMGELLRRFWMPALLEEEVAEPDGPPVKLRLLGEDLVAFRDTSGKIDGFACAVGTGGTLAGVALGLSDLRHEAP